MHHSKTERETAFHKAGFDMGHHIGFWRGVLVTLLFAALAFLMWLGAYHVAV